MSEICCCTLVVAPTEDEVRATRPAFEKSGSGPAAVRVESARSRVQRRMMIDDV